MPLSVPKKIDHEKMAVKAPPIRVISGSFQKTAKREGNSLLAESHITRPSL